MSPSSTTMSPTLMPMRNSMRLSGGTPALRPVLARCPWQAQRDASTTLPNSTSNPSPVGFDQTAAVLGNLRIEELAPQRSETFEGAALIGADQLRIARHIGRQDRRQPTGRGEAAGLAHVIVSPIP